VADPLLSIDDLTVQFCTDRGWSTAVEKVSFDIADGESIGVVGESGSGKSVTALSVLRLHQRAVARFPSGSIRYAGRDLLRANERDLRAMRGRDIAMVFQDPMSSLNPVLTICDQICEPLRLHQRLSQSDARRRAIELLDLVRIPDAARRVDEYPHRLSGGMRQRVMIAMAIACRPRLLIADEPTTALDVTVQAQVIALLRDLRDRFGLTVVLITHNLSVVAEICDEAAVMYAGEIVERGPVGAIFAASRHPYTVSLLGARPKVTSRDDLIAIRGRIPSLRNPPPGCRFADRCSMAEERCHRESPPAHFIDPDHWSRCHFAERVAPVLVASSGEGA
jgi:peptide/nickel transport system ATP-binding protein